MVIAIAWLFPTAASAADDREIVSSADRAAQRLTDQYRQQQATRLARNDDRDSLIAAVLLGLPNDMDGDPFDGQAGVEELLAAKFGQDADAMSTLALTCQFQKRPCTHPEYYDALVRLAPDNAMNWLLLPNDAAPSPAQLHAAVTARTVDSHNETLMRILWNALADQPAPASVRGVDPHELAKWLRVHAMEAAPTIPHFAAVLRMCKPPTNANRDDCIGIGRRLIADQSGTVVARMIGGTIVRRLGKGTPEAAAAKELRRDYVWMDKQLQGNDRSGMEQLLRDTIDIGEWAAYQRAVERMGKSSTPPAGWVPKNPQTLLLSEERTDMPDGRR